MVVGKAGFMRTDIVAATSRYLIKELNFVN